MQTLPKDLLWLVLRFEIRGVWLEHFPIHSHYWKLEDAGRFNSAAHRDSSMAMRLVELSLVCKQWSDVLRSKRVWWTERRGGTYFQFKPGAFADMRSDKLVPLPEAVRAAWQGHIPTIL